MILRHTINDWYANMEGQGWDDSRHDWENDDQSDRIPDAWVDRLPQPEERIAASRPACGAATTSASANNNRRTALTQRELANAARALQARMRGIKDTTIARHLRRSGWPHVSADQVRKALRAHPAQPAKQPPPKNPSSPRRIEPKQKTQRPHGTITVISSPTMNLKAAETGTAARPKPSLAEVAHAVRAKYPQLGMKELTKHVQARGWPMATSKRVKAALQQPPPLHRYAVGQDRSFPWLCGLLIRTHVSHAG